MADAKKSEEDFIIQPEAMSFETKAPGKLYETLPRKDRIILCERHRSDRRGQGETKTW